ncbi:MAG TPA: hypothetical protein VMK83_06760 [Gaiellaceae bacterium]|nr:hypothetical protein [Gaiellaceae bacterium]
MTASLQSARSKWKRACEHYEALKADLVGPHPLMPWVHDYPVTPEIHSGGLEYRFYVDLPPFKSEPCSVLAGDCLFNLRAALDHIVYALHERRYRGKIPTALIEKTQFPILTRPRRDKRHNPIPTHCWHDIGTLSIKQRRAIEFLQPYKRRNDKFSEMRELLGELWILNNIDKHRHLHVAREIVGGVALPSWPDCYGFSHQVFFVPLEGKTEVFRWTFDAIPPDITEKVQMHRHVNGGVALEEGGQPAMLLYRLDQIVNAVDTIIRRFGVFFR